MILETLILHGSDWIEWVDASGRQDADRRVLSPRGLDIRLTRAPSDLRLVHKPSGSVLLRGEPADLRRSVPGRADAAALAPPVEAGYAVAGLLADPSGHFLPRPFSLTAGNAAGHRVRAYRSALGTRFGRGGGLLGRLALADGTPVAWALVRVTVSPPLVASTEFVAMADAHGEFRLALDRLRALNKDAHTPTYPALLSVFASAPAVPGEQPDPDLQPAARVATGVDGSGNPVFGDQLALAIAPGRIAAISSPGRAHLVLQLP
ncbi:MAG: hypothetical protein HGA47_12310 [Zoogloea sp.]|nr:hypothetical protein [Zoogloea sp.]